MARAKTITAALAELRSASDLADKPEAVRTLRSALSGQTQAIVAQAAELAARWELAALAPELCAAYEHFRGDAMSSDKHCRAKVAIVKALHQLKTHQTDVFVDGMSCYWPGRPWGDNHDEATPLRIASAVAYAELGNSTEVEPLVDLLLDPVSDVRLTAVRALAAVGGAQCGLVLRLKTLVGDANPNVMEECFAGLLDCDKDRYLPFVARYMESGDDGLRVSAALALGRSRHPRALDLLMSRWKRIGDPDFKRDLLIAVALLRSEEAIAALLSVLANEEGGAQDALIALSHLKMLPHVRERVEAAIVRTGDQQLRRAFDVKFKE